MILLLDNYDSFTFNLFHYAEQLTDEEIVVKRNDEISIAEADRYNSIILSPGPGLPEEAGILKELIKTYFDKKPILGICLGHQAITEVAGGKIRNLDKVHHGVSRRVTILDKSEPLYLGIPEVFEAGRYHSWISDPVSFPEEFIITAKDAESGEIMSFSHRHFPLKGIQYHPESVMTLEGINIMRNWFSFSRKP